MGMAIAGFTISGFSFGAQPLLHAVSSEVLPRRYRSWGQAADLVANALGGITALLVGGALNRQSDPNSRGFRDYWFMTSGIFAFAAILTLFLYSPPPTKTQTSFTSAEKLKKLDWVGYLLLATGLVLFCISLSWSQNPYPWSSPEISATFTIGLVLMIGLGVYEWKLKEDGMFHHGLFRNKNFSVALICVFCEGIAFFAANQYFAFQVSVLYESDSLLVGVRYSIAMMVSILSAVLTGLYIALTRRVRWITVVAFLIFMCFFVGMALSDSSSNNRVWAYPVLLGAALGMTLCALVTVAQLSTPPGLIASASGLFIAVRSLGGSIGLAICKTGFHSRSQPSLTR
jgi:MFS family permease